MVFSESESRRPAIIAKAFITLAESHIADLLALRVEDRYCSSNFARLLNIAPRHLTNTIKAVLGKSPCDYMEERLIQEAINMLISTTMRVADIGPHFGYKDSANFIKFFKGMTGLTPLQYRKAHRTI